MSATESAPLTIATVNQYTSRFVVREKIWRTIQYGSRFCYGVIALQLQRAEAQGDTEGAKRLKSSYDSWKGIFLRVMHARRTFRLFSESTMMLQMQQAECPWGDNWWLPFTASKSLVIGWHFLDHLKWLQELKLVSGNAPRSGRVSFTLNTMGHFIELVYHITKLRKTKEEKVAKRHKLGALKSALNVVTFAHVAELEYFSTHDTVCGAGGVITSLIDLRDFWPTRSKQS